MDKESEFVCHSVDQVNKFWKKLCTNHTEELNFKTIKL